MVKKVPPGKQANQVHANKGTQTALQPLRPDNQSVYRTKALPKETCRSLGIWSKVKQGQGCLSRGARHSPVAKGTVLNAGHVVAALEST